MKIISSKCENCNKEIVNFYGSGRFCCSKCARGFSTKNKRQEISDKVSLSLGGEGKNRIIKRVRGKITNCLNCEKQIIGNKFCNNYKCQHDYKWKQTKLLIEKNKPIKNAGPSIFKKYLIETRGDKCEICGISNWQGKPLVKILDHINGNPQLDLLSNFRLVCSNCDSQLDTYKNRNRTKGKREYRKKYYKASLV